MTTECVSIHFQACFLGNCCFMYCLILLQALNCCLLYFLILLQALNMSPCELFLYCLILLQALNCCPREDAKRYNWNSFVLNRLLSRSSSVNPFFLSCFFCLWQAFSSSFWQDGDHQSDDLHFSSVVICFCRIFCPLSVLCLVHFSLQPSVFVSSVLCGD